jgi:dTDP-glucose 4,6-dehydratase
MLDVARRCDAHFLLTSTSEVYGDPDPNELPLREEYWGHVNPIGPRACYDESKRFAEALTIAYHQKYSVRINVARIFNTYGPRMALDDGRVVPTFVQQALRRKPLTIFGDGRQTRSFCYITDMVDGLMRLARSEERLPTNLGNPHEINILNFAKEVSRIAGVELSVEHGQKLADDPERRRPDISKAKRVLSGWQPQCTLEAGLRETIGYFSRLLGDRLGEVDDS